MEQNTKRPTYVPKHLLHTIDDLVIFDRDVSFSSKARAAKIPRLVYDPAGIAGC
jgi:hypothetical protein